jgi:hypothetical protein
VTRQNFECYHHYLAYFDLNKGINTFVFKKYSLSVLNIPCKEEGWMKKKNDSCSRQLKTCVCRSKMKRVSASARQYQTVEEAIDPIQTDHSCIH